MFGHVRLERSYKGYLIEGSSESVGPGTDLYFATATVLLKKPDVSLLRVDHFQNPLLTYDDANLAAWFGLGIAEITVDQCLPPPGYYLIPMDVARAVQILRRGAEDRWSGDGSENNPKLVRRGEKPTSKRIVIEFI